MGGFGSGRYGGRPTVESALRLDIDDMMQWGGIRAFARLAGGMRFNFYGDQIEVKFESWVSDPWNSWLRLRYSMTEYWPKESRLTTRFISPPPPRIWGGYGGGSYARS